MQKRPQSAAGLVSSLRAVADGRSRKSRTSILSPLTIEPPTERAATLKKKKKKKKHISARIKEICVSPQEENESACDSTIISTLKHV